jgi:hypothetical protein
MDTLMNEPCLAALLLVPELGDYTIAMPKLDIMAIDQSLGALFGVDFVSAHNVDARLNVPVRTHDVGAIFLHPLPPARPRPPGSSEPKKRKWPGRSSNHETDSADADVAPASSQ